MARSGRLTMANSVARATATKETSIPKREVSDTMYGVGKGVKCRGS